MTLAEEPKLVDADVEGDAGTGASRVGFLISGDTRLDLPPEPTALRESMRAKVVSGGDARSGPDGSGLLAILWEGWMTSLEPAGVDRESFVEILEAYGREIWLWIAGERTWAQCLEGLAGRISRRLPAS